jgi:hypothetical protein
MFAGWGDTTGVSGDGKEGFVREFLMKQFQNYLSDCGSIRGVGLRQPLFDFLLSRRRRPPNRGLKNCQESRSPEKTPLGDS